VRFVDEVKPLAICEGRDEILDLEEVKSIQDKRDKWMLFPKRTIHGLLESTQVEKCLVECEVYAIDSDWGWYYFGCCTCNKKVVKVGTVVKTIHGKEVTTHLWWCEVCKENVSSVSPRFKLHLIVKDDTGETKLMLLDQIAKGMIVESAATLLNGSFDELEDPTDLPDAILAVVGKTFTFGISVEKEHVLYGSEIYKNSVNLLDNEENIEGLSTPSTTPSTKRKGAWSDPPRDITSTSKNLRLKTIKVEKMSDLEVEANKKP
ncbi:unnamed protein product, partial [Brassica rapa]